MKKILLLIFINVFVANIINGQDCTINLGGPGQKTADFFGGSGCVGGGDGSSFSSPGNYSIKIGNNNTLVINGDVTINGTLTIELVGSTSEVLVESPYTLSTINLAFTGSATGKVLTVNGPDGAIIVDNNLDFGGNTIELDGAGDISADNITGAGNMTCNTSGGCPAVSANSCDDGSANGDGSGFCDTSLPIELKSFSASKSNKNIDLNWITAKEENFSHFEIERSVDQNNWEQIGLVQGLGESMSDVYYDFTDRSAPFGQIQYRLKSVDIDASFEYSPVVTVEVGFEGKLAVSPNPVRDASNLKIQVPSEFKEDLGYVGLFDLSGVKIQEFRNFNTDGTLQIDQKLKSGMYILKVNHNGLQENIRVVIQ